MRPILQQIEAMLAGGADVEGLVSIALIAASEIELPEEELNGAVRRSVLLLAAGGDPTRELELDGRAVAALATDLDTSARRDELRQRLVALRAPSAGLPLVEGSLARLLADDDLAWRTFACALLAHELGS
jgi:hypothetical protein